MFDIKINGRNYTGNTINKRVRFRGLADLIGYDMAEKLCQKAMNSKEERPKFKLRRGLSIKFYNRL